MMDRHDSPADDNAVVPRIAFRPNADDSTVPCARAPLNAGR